MDEEGELVISGDCGGTNSRLSLWLIPKGATETKEATGVVPGKQIFSKKYQNEEHASFSVLCHLFMVDANLKSRLPRACVLACAGPILDNTVDFTNIKEGWRINGPELQADLGIEHVQLINDFQAMGYGILTLKPEEFITLNDAPKKEGAPIATIGAGTGLGECYLTSNGQSGYNCYACEGGHTDYAPIGELEHELRDGVMAEHGCERRLSVERIVSGPGLASIFKFLLQRFPERANAAIRDEFNQAGKSGPRVIATNATEDALCKQAMDIFIDVYGREAGNAILKYLPRGGFYITGGIAAKNAKYFTSSDIFLNAAFDKGRVSPAIRAVPIYLVLTEELGERGAHYYAYQLLQAHNEAP